MLRQLLKYEFKATKSLYFGLYLAVSYTHLTLPTTERV